MSLSIAIGLPAVVHSAGQPASVFTKSAKLLFLLAVFAILGALVLRRYCSLGQTNRLPPDSNSYNQDNRNLYVEGEHFEVDEKTFKNKQEYMDHLYSTDEFFRNFRNQSGLGKNITHFARCRSFIGEKVWIVYTDSGATMPVGPSSSGMSHVVADRDVIGPKLTAQEVDDFLDYKKADLD